MMNAFVENVKKKIKTPTPKSQANKEKKLKKKKAKAEAAIQEEDSGPGTIYIGHIPHGFYEEEMQQYFSQFGKVTNVRIARSRKSLRAKGYGYVQFKSTAVAQIAAEAMNNYLFFEKLLKCEYIPEDKLHPDTFKGWKSRRTSSSKNRIIHNRKRTEESLQKSKQKRMLRLQKLQSYLKDNDVEYKVKKSKKEVKVQ